MKHVLIVEDELKIREILRDYLEKAEYRVSCLERGDHVIPFVRKSPPDMILLDVMLPEMDGMEVCRELRKFSQVPVIMITARVEEIDRILGLELGADDYICKPFSPREVVARVRTILRRISPETVGKKVKSGVMTLDEDTHQVLVRERELKITPIEFGILRLLMLHPNKVFSRTDLVSRVQGYDFEGYDRTIDTHIKNLRKKISVLLPEQEVIVSVYGVGYKFQV